MPLKYEETVNAYDQYVTSLCAQEDDALRDARETSGKEGLPEIAVTASEGKMLHVLARAFRARRILEIGTLGGYSAIWLARALPTDGKLISLELEPHHAEVARKNIERAGLATRVEIRVGPALDSLKKMAADGEAQFDVVFIDADKSGYVDYLNASLPLLRTGGLLLADNTLPEAVLDPSDNSRTKPYNRAAAAHPALVSAIFPTLRDGGIDGLMVSLKI
ncbi:MAG: O-methyltransferase [Kiritimatiellae bacterium]|nr:O-methyltransferase [Kiritimatiellia bacterium]